MLGLFRYTLALMVALSHLSSGWLYWQGAYAVFCFYLISGYLMSYVLNGVYSGAGGNRAYAVNRSLRIYPVYLVVLVLSLLVSVATAAIRTEPTGTGLPFSLVMPLPGDVAQWLGNVLLLVPWDVPLQVSQGWSLRVELVYYALMPLLVRHWWSSAGWFLLSLLYSAWLVYTGASFADQYTTVAGASIAFSSGALIYHLRSRFQLAAYHVLPALLLYLVHLWFAPLIWGFSRDNELGFAWLFQGQTYGLYGNLACGAYLLYAIACGTSKGSRLETAGNVLGDLAYPIFLVHWVAGAVVAGLGVPPSDRALYLGLSLLLVHLLSLLLHYAVESPVNTHFRDRVRKWADSARPADD